MNKQIEKKKKAELERKIRKRVAAEEKAYRIVEKFVDETVTEDYLKDAGQFITPSHYEDIVVERSIAKLCGYPVCANILKNVSKQKYHISSRTNKVYDMTERKNYCSNQCYKSSKYFEKQISTTPVWGREEEPRVHFDLLPLDAKSGSVGVEVIGGESEVQTDLNHLQKLDRFEEKRKQTLMKCDQSKSSKRGLTDKLEALHVDDKFSSLSGTKTSEQEIESDIKSVVEIGQEINDKTDNTEIQRSEKVKESDRDLNPEVKVTETQTLQPLCTNKDPRNVNDSEGTDNLVCSSSDITENKTPPKTTQLSDSHAKLEYLMKLLDKKQHLLNQMVQIESVDISSKSDTVQTKGDNQGNQLKGDYQGNQLKGDNREKIGPELSASLEPSESNKSVSEKSDIERDICSADPFEVTGASKSNSLISTELGSSVLDPVKSDLETSKDKNALQVIKTVSVTQNTSDGVVVNTESEKSTLSGNESRTSSHGGEKIVVGEVPDKSSEKPRKKINTVEMICRTMKLWITAETLKFLKRIPSDQKRSDDSLQLELKSEELEKHLGIDSLVGEETSAGLKDVPQNPVPNIEALQRETKEFNVKVNEFYKGSFTYKHKEVTQDDQAVKDMPVYLPTVDSHNQLLIRRKIVMERFDKTMPDLLPPLKLSIQDVFSDLRQLVASFSLDSKNILFKPAEWTIVSLVILKLLSGRNQKITRAFGHPSSKHYLSVLLKGIGENLDNLDRLISNMLL